jgi:hypothetical protein
MTGPLSVAADTLKKSHGNRKREQDMTQTAGARAGARKNGAKGNGVKIERIYTTPGVHPYDEVTWEKRDVVQQNWKTGETIFEQRGVEFPDFWSVNDEVLPWRGRHARA